MAKRKAKKLARAIAREILISIRSQQAKKRRVDKERVRPAKPPTESERPLSEAEIAVQADQMALSMACEIAGWPEETARLLSGRGVNAYVGAKMLRDALVRVQ